jgi:hypothetical protein
MAHPYPTVPAGGAFLVDPEPYVRKYGEQYRIRIIDALAFIGPGSGYDYPGFNVDEYLDCLIPKVKPVVPAPKLPSFQLLDGTLVPAKGVTVHGTGFTGIVTAAIVEGEEVPFTEPQHIFDHDVINFTVGEGPPRISNEPVVSTPPEPTLPELYRELADLLEVQGGLDEDDDIDRAYQIDGDIEVVERRIARLKP